MKKKKKSRRSELLNKTREIKERKWDTWKELEKGKEKERIIIILVLIVIFYRKLVTLPFP